MSGGKAFFDTNILIYMQSDQDPVKNGIAQRVFRQHQKDSTAVLSTQVVQEFYAVASKKLQVPRARLLELIHLFLDLPLVVLDASHIIAAVNNEAKYQISFWDGLIVAAAEAGGTKILYTEDLNHGQMYGSVKAQNPFME